MTPGDLAYLRHVIDAGHVSGRVLEVGAHEWAPGGSTRELCRAAGIDWTGCDIEPGPGVDFTLDLYDKDAVSTQAGRWDTVFVPNVLEHLYDPIRGLESCVELLAPGGRCIIVTPVVWELHDYPGDYWRPMPGFYREFAGRHRMEQHETFWIVNDRLIPQQALTRDGQEALPSKAVDRRIDGRTLAVYSKVVHRLFRTNASAMFFRYTALGTMLARQ